MYEDNIFLDIVWLDRIKPDWICLEIRKDGIPLIGNLNYINKMCNDYLKFNEDHTFNK